MKVEKIARVCILASILIIYSFFILKTLLKLKSLPTCLYGCDYYYEQGMIYNLIRSNLLNFGKSSTHVGFVPATLPLYYVFPALLSFLLKISPFVAEKIFSALLLPISFLLFFVIFYKLFENNYYLAVLGATISFPLFSFPIFKATNLAQVFSVPLLIFSLIVFLKEREIRSSILLGISIGVASLSHQAFFFSSFILVIFSTISMWFLKIKEDKIVLCIKKKELSFLTLAIIIGFVISLIFWFKPIFVFHGKTVAYGYLTPDFKKIDVYFGFLWKSLEKLFFDLSTPFNLGISILSILGFVFLLFRKNKFLLVLLLSLMLCIYNYLIIVPLTGKHFSPNHNLRFFWTIICGILATYFVNCLKNYLDLKKISFIFLTILLVGFCVYGNVITFENKINNDKFFSLGYNEIPKMYTSLQKFLLKNTSVDDVVLTTNELCFALNGLSGIKCILYRRGHSSQFDDLDRLYLDAAIILYGNDTQRKLDLIKKYNITYLYWDINWVSTEYYFDNQGKIAGWYDPITILYTPEREAELKRYNISYFVLETWLDPAFRSEDYKKFKIIFISPENYRSFERPWKADLDPYLVEVWNYTENNKTIARFWRINVN